MSEADVTVAKVDELADGEMKQVSANGTEILLARVGGKFYAAGAHCPHYGAPLAEGALSGERIVCPWHHSCFNVTTGDLEEPPAFDSLPSYKVTVENDQVIVSVPEEAQDRRTPEMTERDTKDGRLFVIVGGGAAGYMAAQTLREDGFAGRVIMITREDRFPYDRPNLSKDYLQGTAESGWMPLRPDEFYAKHGVEVLRKKEVARIDAGEKTITFTGGDSMRFDSLLIATGGTPRHLDIPGFDLKNVFLLRSFDDADAIIAAAQAGSRAVVIGASFIGMETAASLAQRQVSVTVVAPDKVPFEKTLGPEIGKLIQKAHEAKGVQFKLGSTAASFEGDGAVRAVLLDSGERIEADLAIVGVGVKPATDFLEGVELNKDGGVTVDRYFKAADNVYAAGDIAFFPSPLTGESLRIEHWRTAMQQGRIAAHNMAGRTVAYDGVPFFWTHQFDIGLLYVGHAKDWDEVFYQGEISARDFLAFYIRGDRVLAVAGMNRDQDAAAISELMRLDRMPSMAEIKNDEVSFIALL
ncbi:MAG TPA: FAD-dependent oxidoreductase [Pyrinomonadaceae bacterium]|nr:FAD-dependent oxidoreductase [Pyrinomonadaceae bacterium]